MKKHSNNNTSNMEKKQSPHLLVSAPRDPKNHLKENAREHLAKCFFDYVVTNKHEGDPNKQDEFFGLTPLHHAAWNNSVELLDLLIEAGADVNKKDKNNETPYDRSRVADKSDEIEESFISNLLKSKTKFS